ncbi:MAG: MbnP family copper-binding protein [Polyangiales bacterium]
MTRSKSTVAVLFACSLLGLAACEDGDDLPAPAPLDAGIATDGGTLQPVTLRFKAKLGSEDLVCGRTYAGQGVTMINATPQDFRFFVQEAYLLDAAGKEVRVEFDDGLPFQTKDVALIDFTDATGSCGGTGGQTVNVTITGKVPPGTYNGIVLVNGVPETLNHGNPATAAQPLRAPGASWDWLSGYRFVMAELAPQAPGMDGGVPMPSGHGDAGAGDAGAGGHGGGPGSASAIHVGSTGCTGMIGTAGAITCAKPNRNRVKLTSFNPTTQSIVADLSAVFANIDLAAGSQCHGMGASCPTGFAALGVDFANGQAAATQTVFRVE